MGVEDVTRIPGIGGPEPSGPAPAAAPGVEFRRLLERLEKLTGEAGPVRDAGDLERAVRRADEEFVAAMTLRRMLEQAYRERSP